METLNNAYNSATTTASKALYGDNTENTSSDYDSNSREPRSGAGGFETDDPSKPYDGGNDPSLNKPAADDEFDDPSSTRFNPGQGATSSGPSDSTDTTGAPYSGTGTQDKHQGAGRPSEAPNDEERAAVDSERRETEQEQKKDYGDDFDNDAGPGATGSGESGDTGTSAPPMGGAANEVGGPKPQTESKGEGTGTKWVKSSGMAAEGGDFDATKPGAGREADRLLEEKGINRSGGDNTGAPETGDDDDSSSKPSLKDRIKDKLHR